MPDESGIRLKTWRGMNFLLMDHYHHLSGSKRSCVACVWPAVNGFDGHRVNQQKTAAPPPTSRDWLSARGVQNGRDGATWTRNRWPNYFIKYGIKRIGRCRGHALACARSAAHIATFQVDRWNAICTRTECLKTGAATCLNFSENAARNRPLCRPVGFGAPCTHGVSSEVVLSLWFSPVKFTCSQVDVVVGLLRAVCSLVVCVNAPLIGCRCQAFPSSAAHKQQQNSFQ